MYPKCIICGGEFEEKTLVDGKCKICVVEYPKAKSLEEAIKQKGPQKDQMITLTEARVRDIIREEIARFHDVEGGSQKKDERGAGPSRFGKYHLYDQLRRDH